MLFGKYYDLGDMILTIKCKQMDKKWKKIQPEVQKVFKERCEYLKAHPEEIKTTETWKEVYGDDMPDEEKLKRQIKLDSMTDNQVVDPEGKIIDLDPNIKTEINIITTEKGNKIIHNEGLDTLVMINVPDESVQSLDLNKGLSDEEVAKIFGIDLSTKKAYDAATNERNYAMYCAKQLVDKYTDINASEAAEAEQQNIADAVNVIEAAAAKFDAKKEAENEAIKTEKVKQLNEMTDEELNQPTIVPFTFVPESETKEEPTVTTEEVAENVPEKSEAKEEPTVAEVAENVKEAAEVVSEETETKEVKQQVSEVEVAENVKEIIDVEIISEVAQPKKS